jgi:hypothetical protein
LILDVVYHACGQTPRSALILGLIEGFNPALAHPSISEKTKNAFIQYDGEHARPA